MKIIGVSNFDIETVNDILIAENVNEYHGKLFVRCLNDDSGPASTYFYKSVKDNHDLYEFEP